MIENENSCKQAKQTNEIILRIKTLEDDLRSIEIDVKRIDKENTKTDVQYTQIMETLGELKNDVKELKDKPTKYLDFIYMTIIATIIGFLFKHFGV